MDGKGLEAFLRTAGGSSNSLSIGEGLAQMFGGGNLPQGVDPKEMEAMWKMLDDMAESNPDKYKKFIDEQMKEMKQEINREKEVEAKNQTIQSEPAFAVRALIARKVEEKDRKPKKEGIKLFDFNDSQIKESYIDNDEKSDPLEEPKLYLNIVYNENLMAPLNKQRDLADPKNDREWLIIPTIFAEPKERKSIDGSLCIHYDCHVNSCVIAKIREDNRAMKSISNYLVMKFQEHIEDKFIIHKKSIKILKKKRYKCSKGTDSQRVTPFVLPKEHDIRQFKQMKDKVKREQEEEKKKGNLAPAKEDIKIQSITQNTLPQKNEEIGSIKIPGQSKPQKETQKKPVIIEVGKTIPNFDLQVNGDTITMILNVEEENSAKDIDLDISESMLKLSSKNYELNYDFKAKGGYLVQPDQVGAKFSKLKKTLTLTFVKQQV